MILLERIWVNVIRLLLRIMKILLYILFLLYSLSLFESEGIPIVNRKHYQMYIGQGFIG